MNSELPKLFDAIDELLVRYEKWEEPLRMHRSREFLGAIKDKNTWQAFERGLAELEGPLKSQSDPQAELYRLFDQLCSFYLGRDVEQRSAIREFIAERRTLSGLVWAYANHLATRIKGPEDGTTLELALAAVSMENCGLDYRDTLTTLADLYVAAEEVGIDPKPPFEAMSELSTDSPTRGGIESFALTLRQFESYAVLSERRARGRPYREGAWS